MHTVYIYIAVPRTEKKLRLIHTISHINGIIDVVHSQFNLLYSIPLETDVKMASWMDALNLLKLVNLLVKSAEKSVRIQVFVELKAEIIHVSNIINSCLDNKGAIISYHSCRQCPCRIRGIWPSDFSYNVINNEPVEWDRFCARVTLNFHLVFGQQFLVKSILYTCSFDSFLNRPEEFAYRLWITIGRDQLSRLKIEIHDV